MDVQRNLEANMEKRMKDVYGPPPGLCSLLHNRMYNTDLITVCW